MRNKSKSLPAASWIMLLVMSSTYLGTFLISSRMEREGEREGFRNGPCCRAIEGSNLNRVGPTLLIILLPSVSFCFLRLSSSVFLNLYVGPSGVHLIFGPHLDYRIATESGKLLGTFDMQHRKWISVVDHKSSVQ